MEYYEGEYEDDMRDGKGVFYFNSGAVYEGEFKKERYSKYLVSKHFKIFLKSPYVTYD